MRTRLGTVAFVAAALTVYGAAAEREVAGGGRDGARGPALLWRHPLATPWQPQTLNLAAERGAVVVGMRNSPTDSLSQTMTLDLHNNGTVLGLAPGGDTVASKRSAATVSTGWDKAITQTTLQVQLAPKRLGSNGWSVPFEGDPAMWRSTAISDDGVVGAVLLEPKPDAAHLNNRSSLLRIYTGLGRKKAPSFVLQIDGLGATDPQAVAISKLHTAATGPGHSFVCGAIMGSEQVVIQFDTTLEAGKIVYRKSGGPIPASSIAVSLDGKYVAVAGESAVVLLARSRTDGSFAATNSTLSLPGTSLGLSPAALEFGTTASHAAATFLVIGWVDAEGTTLALSMHTIATDGTVAVHWHHMRKCPDGSAGNLITSNSLAVSEDGRWIALGSWGCSVATAPRVNALVYSGAGQLLYEAAVPGQIWAAAVDTLGQRSGAGVAAFGFASWSTDDSPALVSVYTNVSSAS